MKDLVLLDLMMPGMDGFEVLAHIKQQARFQHLPIIMISAADDYEKVAKGIELGAEDYLTKPFNPVILRARVSSALEKRRSALAQIESLSFIDTLTGLPNIAAFTRYQQQGKLDFSRSALLEISLTKYAALSDAYDKTTAQDYLQQQLIRLQACLPDQTYLFKYDVASFLVLWLAFEHEESVIAHAKKILTDLNVPVYFNEIVVVEELRLGIVVNYSETSADELLQQVRSATSQACKKMPIALYADSIKTSILEKMQLEADLREAISNHELVLFYQPQVDVKTGKICAAEALVRWRHPVKGMIPPSDFIPLAEENGMIIDLGESVIRIAAAQLKQWIESWPDDWSFPISVNISAQHLIQPTLVDYVQKTLETASIPPHLIKLELTESALVEDELGTIAILKSMQSMGLKISLDDIGTGFSSLSYLLELPLNQLKIDKKFVDNLVSDKRSQFVLNHVIGLAHDLCLDVVVEGVEDASQAELVIASGVDYIQGYYYFKPMPADDFYKVLCEQR